MCGSPALISHTAAVALPLAFLCRRTEEFPHVEIIVSSPYQINHQLRDGEQNFFFFNIPGGSMVNLESSTIRLKFGSKCLQNIRMMEVYINTFILQSVYSL